MLAIEWEQGLNDAWARIATFVPKLLGFLVILVIGYFLAKALSRIVDGLLERVGFDRWVERGSLKTALERSKFDASDIMAVIVFWAVFLIALQLAFGIFGNNPVSDLITGIIAYLPNVLVAVIILVIAAAVAKVVTDILSATLGSVQGGAPAYEHPFPPGLALDPGRGLVRGHDRTGADFLGDVLGRDDHWRFGAGQQVGNGAFADGDPEHLVHQPH